MFAQPASLVRQWIHARVSTGLASRRSIFRLMQPINADFEAPAGFLDQASPKTKNMQSYSFLDTPLAFERHLSGACARRARVCGVIDWLPTSPEMAAPLHCKCTSYTSCPFGFF